MTLIDDALTGWAKVKDFVARHTVLCVALAAALVGIWFGSTYLAASTTEYNQIDKQQSMLRDTTGHITNQAAYDELQAKQNQLDIVQTAIKPLTRLFYGVCNILLSVVLAQIVLFCMTSLKFTQSYTAFTGGDSVLNAEEYRYIRKTAVTVWIVVLAAQTLTMFIG